MASGLMPCGGFVIRLISEGKGACSQHWLLDRGFGMASTVTSALHMDGIGCNDFDASIDKSAFEASSCEELGTCDIKSNAPLPNHEVERQTCRCL